jgi:hypothetical protein
VKEKNYRHCRKTWLTDKEVVARDQPQQVLYHYLSNRAGDSMTSSIRSQSPLSD